MNSQKVDLKITCDGSHTLFVDALNENYHSLHGAYAEAIHVFIEMGLRPAVEKFYSINVFEVGFGTGLNAILAYNYAIKNSHSLCYTGIEKYPLTQEIVSQLNYGNHWKNKKLDEIFKLMHEEKWNSNIMLDTNIQFKKLDRCVLNYPLESNYYHVIFFDAFAPEKQPEMWSIELFSKLHTALQSGGLLVTYCAKGQFKRDLKSAGFEVETLEGPPGKREMVRGIKK